MATKKHSSKAGKAQPRKKNTKPAAPAESPEQAVPEAALPVEQVAEQAGEPADAVQPEPAAAEPASSADEAAIAHEAERPEEPPAAQDAAAGGEPQAEEQASAPAEEQTPVPQVEQPPPAATPKAKKPSRKGKAKGKGKAAAEKGLSALDAAAKVLAETGQAMSCKELIGAMAAAGYWSSPAGKTPDATLYSAILRELQVKGEAARFTKVGRGRFAARGAA